MSKMLLNAEKSKTNFCLDPRTKILLVITIGSILVGGSYSGGMIFLRPVLAALPLLLFVSVGRWKTALKISVIYLVLFLLELFIAPLASGVIGFLVVALSGIFTRFVPSLALGYYLVSTTTVSEFIASMERIHMPQKIIIPFAVMFRFFPTVGEEYSSISDAMKMRGISLGGGKPMNMLEYRLVPLMMSTVRIGDELSAASLTRGLGGPEKRTNICEIGFHIQDILLLVFAIVCFILVFVV